MAGSNSRAARLYSGGFPAVTMTQPAGRRCWPNVLYCRNCSIAGMRVSDAQLTSSKKRMPSGMPLFSTASYAAAMISLMV